MTANTFLSSVSKVPGVRMGI